jgi:hypothetical protein
MQFVAHAAAGIEDQTHRNGLVVHGELRDRLRNLIFEQAKFSFSNPETGRFSASLTETGTRIRVVSTRILAPRRFLFRRSGLVAWFDLDLPGQRPASQIASTANRHM